MPYAPMIRLVLPEALDNITMVQAICLMNADIIVLEQGIHYNLIA